MRRFSIPLLALIGVSAVGLMFGVSSSANRNSRPVLPSPVRAAQQQPADVIDGSATPELIPDQVAYSLLFRLLSNRNTEEEKQRARSYLKLIFGCGECDTQTEHKKHAAPEEAHIKAFLVVIKKFERRVGALDRRAQEIHDLNGPNLSHEALAQLNELQKQKEEIISNLVASLPNHLGADGVEKLRRHVNGRVKRKTKIKPEHIHN
jgi:hypothetical protein